MPQAVLECLRYDGSVQFTMRAAMDDVSIEGDVVPRGTIVFLMLGAANRDPVQFTDPDHLEITRKQGRLSHSAQAFIIALDIDLHWLSWNAH